MHIAKGKNKSCATATTFSSSPRTTLLNSSFIIRSIIEGKRKRYITNNLREVLPIARRDKRNKRKKPQLKKIWDPWQTLYIYNRWRQNAKGHTKITQKNKTSTLVPIFRDFWPKMATKKSPEKKMKKPNIANSYSEEHASGTVLALLKWPPALSRQSLPDIKKGLSNSQSFFIFILHNSVLSKLLKPLSESYTHSRLVS